jgi:hypothetical protein
MFVISANSIKAQNGVIKVEVTENIGGYILPCTGEYLWGDVDILFLYTKNNWIALIKNANVYGYKDAAGTEPTGNVYELSQTVPGLTFMENTGTFKLNGKVIAVFHFDYHITINANGVVTQEHSTFRTDCK